jgi:hypothetical protein
MVAEDDLSEHVSEISGPVTIRSRSPFFCHRLIIEPWRACSTGSRTLFGLEVKLYMLYASKFLQNSKALPGEPDLVLGRFKQLCGSL